MAQPALAGPPGSDRPYMTGPADTRVFPDGLTLEVLDDASAAARWGARWLADTMTRVAMARGLCVLAISGGRSPWPMFRKLVAIHEVPWERIHVVQVDERDAPAGSPDRNWTAASAVFSGLPADHLHPMPVEHADPEAAAADYARLLEDICGPGGIDIAHLGLGPDGHTASLFPNDAVVDVLDRPVAWTSGEHAGRRRMTLTFPALNQCSHLLWQVLGHSKRAMLDRLLEADAAIPAGRVRRDRATVLADRSATE